MLERGAMIHLTDKVSIGPVLMAPLAGVTDRTYRGILTELGADLTYTEMVSAKALHYKNANTETLLRLAPNQTKIAVQLFGNDPEILAKYADVKMSTVDENYDIAYGDNDRYIVKSMDNNKWGLIKILKDGTIETPLEFEYDSITYDIDTDYYILCKNGTWYVYDLYKKEVVSVESSNPIYNVWRNN